MNLTLMGLQLIGTDALSLLDVRLTSAIELAFLPEMQLAPLLVAMTTLPAFVVGFSVTGALGARVARPIGTIALVLGVSLPLVVLAMQVANLLEPAVLLAVFEEYFVIRFRLSILIVVTICDPMFYSDMCLTMFGLVSGYTLLV